MRLFFAAVLFALTASSASAATAFFTGNSEMVQTVTFQAGWRCEYNYAGRTFWMVFTSFCPSTVEVQ